MPIHRANGSVRCQRAGVKALSNEVPKGSLGSNCYNFVNGSVISQRGSQSARGDVDNTGLFAINK